MLEFEPETELRMFRIVVRVTLALQKEVRTFHSHRAFRVMELGDEDVPEHPSKRPVLIFT